jgi:hypothetical protein
LRDESKERLHRRLNIPPKRAQYSSKEAQQSQDSSQFSSYDAYVRPNYGVSASVVYHASSNQVGIPKKFVVYIDLKAENTHGTFHLIG